MTPGELQPPPRRVTDWGIFVALGGLIVAIVAAGGLYVRNVGQEEAERLTTNATVARSVADLIETRQRGHLDLLLGYAQRPRVRDAMRRPTRMATDLGALAHEVVAETTVPSGVQSHLSVAPGIPAVAADPAQVKLVLRNLVNNALQAMPDGGRLDVGVNAEGGAVIASVADTGVGIPREHLDRIFQPLFTTKARGIGLGLSIARNLVEVNGGRLGVESEPGRGSRFTLRLPAAPSAA